VNDFNLNNFTRVLMHSFNIHGRILEEDIANLLVSFETNGINMF
jgi:hypothetical protein